MVRLEEKEERRGRRKRSVGEGEDEREESEFSSRLHDDGSNFRSEETRGETERFASRSREREAHERERSRRGRSIARERGREVEKIFSPSRAHTRACKETRERRGGVKERRKEGTGRDASL